MRRSFLVTLLLSVVPCLAAGHPPSTVRPAPPQHADDTVHTRASVPWLQDWKHPAKAGRPLPVYFGEVSVHDPAILEAEGRYYIFGSHLAAAKSDDLLAWESIADGVNPQNPLFENVEVELAEALEWAQADTLWAPDVIRLADGRYYMYYNACQGDAPRSALGLAVADRPEGPYRDQGILLRSGMWGLPSEDGTIYDPLVHPNTVDPDVFFDASGRLWMLYGSYSGGLFILRMDPATGLPLPGQGYGKHLIGGNHARIEGGTIAYSAETRWYYLFTSFGGLDAVGGYNVRVSRSRHPDGPYVDARGVDMSTVRSDPALPLFDDASIEPYGQKLIGNVLFDRKLGEPGSGSGQGYVSPGHNSVYRDPRNGRWSFVFHTRFPGRGEAHQVRVHDMFLNADGWPVLAPHRYAGGWDRVLLPARVAGDYKLAMHDKAISASVPVSQDLTLGHDGRITGALDGTWRLAGRYLTLELADGPRRGVVSWQWNETAEAYVPTFSVIGDDGVALWGSALPARTTGAAIKDILADIVLPATTSADLSLPTDAARGATITWRSGDARWIDHDGQVTRPEPAQGDRRVRLTATVHLRGAMASKSFYVTVKARRADGLVAHYSFDDTLADASGQRAVASIAGGLVDAPGGILRYAAGVAGNAVEFDGTSSVRLPSALIQGHRYTVAFWVRPDALVPFSTTFFGARDPDHWVSFLPMGHDWVGNDTMLWSGTAWYDAGLGMRLQAGQWSHVAFSVDDGQVDVYIDGQLRFSGAGFPDVFDGSDGVFSLGGNWWDAPFVGRIDELRIYEVALDAAEVELLVAP